MASRIGLIKRGWNEIPDIVGSMVMAGLGLCFGAYGVYKYYEKDGDNRKYKLEYTVIRHDDPRVAKVHKDYLGDHQKGNIN